MEAVSLTVSMTPKRRWLRFTLRLLFSGMTLLCVVLGIWTHRAREQRRLVERIRHAGGRVTHDPKTSIGGVRLGEVRIPSAVITLLGNDYFFDVIEAEIFDAAILSELPRLRSLDCLHINSHTLTDDDFAPIAKLSHLKAIDIYGDREAPNTRIGDRSMALLAELPVLELVNVESSRITAGGLALLARSKSITRLYVSSPDESMNELAADPFRSQLWHLSIRRSTAGGFGKIVESWYSGPPGPRPAAPAK